MTIKNNPQLCPKFINLVDLTLGQWCLDSDFYVLIIFLQSSPKLEKLTLKLEKVNDFLQMYADPIYFKPFPHEYVFSGYNLQVLFYLMQYYPHPYEHIIGDELTERSFTCEHLKIVEIICMEDDEPLAKIVEGLFVDNGMNSVRFDIKYWSQIPFQLPAFYRELYNWNVQGSIQLLPHSESFSFLRGLDLYTFWFQVTFGRTCRHVYMRFAKKKKRIVASFACKQDGQLVSYSCTVGWCFVLPEWISFLAAKT